jgi:hypothetical protein
VRVGRVIPTVAAADAELAGGAHVAGMAATARHRSLHSRRRRHGGPFHSVRPGAG